MNDLQNSLPKKNKLRNSGIFLLVASIVACELPLLIALVATTTAASQLTVSPSIRIFAIVLGVIGALLTIGALIHKSRAGKEV